MTEPNKWTRFLPSKLEKWLKGDEENPDEDGDNRAGPVDPLLTYEPPGVEWSPGGESPVGEMCPVCGTAYPEDAPPGAACPACGAERPTSGLPAGVAPSPSRYLDPDQQMQPRRPCTACGGEVDIDGYCMTCGAKQASERDHFREEPARWLGGVCDRGIRHARNEDAMALAAAQGKGERGVMVVCDGVSTSEDSDIASLAGAQAARDVLSGNQPKGVGTAESRSAAMTQALVEACHAANEAVVSHTALDSTNAASATFAAAVVSEGRIFYANLGDSRVYWLPDAAEAVQLSVDDSVAQARIEAGATREEAENGPGAHSITKWLGRDAPDLQPRTGELSPEGPGWLLVCSDGLWNYASPPEAVRTVLTEAVVAEPQPTSIVDLAERMVTWANEQGGRDNITVALARLGDLDMLAPAVEPPAVAAVAPPSPVGGESPSEPVFEQPDWSAAPHGDAVPGNSAPGESAAGTSAALESAAGTSVPGSAAGPLPGPRAASSAGLPLGEPPRAPADAPPSPEGAGPVTAATAPDAPAIVDTPPAD